MADPLFNPVTKHHTDTLLKNLPQSLIISGKKGTNTVEVAAYITRTVGGISESILPKKRSKDSKATTIDLDGGKILTEDVREIYTAVRGKQSLPRIFLFQSADKMMPAAQHALLKLLEEPNSNIYFILETHYPDKLLDTIRSRSQKLYVLPISEQQTINYLESFKTLDARKKQQLQFIADGLPEEMDKLINEDDYFQLRAKIMSDARSFLLGTIYEKVLIAQKYQQSRDEALLLLESTIQIARRTISTKPQDTVIEQLTRLVSAKEGIENNFNIRIQLLASVL